MLVIRMSTVKNNAIILPYPVRADQGECSGPGGGMTERRLPTDAELRSWLLARIDDLQRAITDAASVPMSGDQRAEYERLTKALADLEGRVKQTLADEDPPSRSE